jgi:lambda family phage minor tail protein L
MTNLIATDAQSQEITSGLVDLFELGLPDGSTLYFHAGLTESLDEIKFRDKKAPTNPISAGNFIVGQTYTIVSGTGFTSIGALNNTAGTSFVATGVGTGTGTANQTDHTVREYTPMPMMIDGLDLNADGASARPALTVANIGTLFYSQLGNFKNDDLIGQRLIRRQTFQKYLYGESGDASPPIELRTQEYIIDRIGQETSVSVTFEMAAPFDLEGIKLPRRIVVGKYCSWKYQGHDAGKGGGCTWREDGGYSFRNSSDSSFSHNAYFNFEDSPLVINTTSFGTYSSSTAYTTDSYVSHSGKKWLCILNNTGQTPSSLSSYWKEVFTWVDYSSSTSYSLGSLVRSSNTIWKSTHASNQNNTPAHGTGHWLREEVCGKTLQSCKVRYGVVPIVNTSANQPPSGRTSKAARLPFGSFPGTLKY